uniref:Lectin n=1 Tax=uncultured bacterium BLR7 TaxID=506523 RepID=C0INQ1_9BACT|nr:hypothetical protein AKSOIL_0095 [uncultured bacterium BLR7]
MLAGSYIASAQTPAPAAPLAARPPMTFFITSAGLPGGANLHGLAGADAHCTDLARNANGERGVRTWRAYLSTQERTNKPAVNARDRIGNGPWHNAAGEMIAKDVDDLHGTPDRLKPQVVLNEFGQQGTGYGAPPDPRDQSWAYMQTHPFSVRHEILTGSQPDGRAFPPDHDHTCDNWTSEEEGNSPLRARTNTGPGAEIGQPEIGSVWNSHGISGGCSHEALARSHSAGLFYCSPLAETDVSSPILRGRCLA